jgi:hypothetical protein
MYINLFITICMCKPSLNIIFTKKVNSVTVTTADGIKLRQCN